ncbi:hydroxymethylbilane synthase [Cryobacterium sp. TMT1-21]|uniref:Porphobilinogen deaminase n=1 Tax=Cryobacterium shii TaxID=1259235 RepID=A0AAQ2C3X0_9MICO|nr:MULTISPECIES: hydroxymethylbilane synthase [Cryobacterium]TFC41162.1 hydroxymethylbilane synthase [Cryobacterium shii]TFC87617.1 hydroxymethylbilane synthase [Cryobacterium sp. TmT2-59]TFD07367.1 hydroxymethylbilane synthase [Cryobacterium sp. TMT1-21]TFD15639.1 hydroxymethylbilane synthase [Cryobacterium sp. TMT2-23]TFD16441.1 hydroxymethylbilane synthase [Cryobacterium sp. TMT4-10]
MSLIRVGTRGSALALAQTTAIANRIATAAGAEVEIVPITTHGDTSREPLSSLGGTGVFASALRESLLAGDCDVVVHSLKDLPTAAYPGLRIGATPKRADARDVLVARGVLTFDTLPQGARVGTGSPRRVAQLLARRPDLDIVDIRGNVDTRLGRVAEGDLDAVILAAAGLSRLALLESVDGEYLELSEWPTAPGQGALAIEVREGKIDRALASALATLNHATTQATTTAERLVLARLEAGCAAPIGTMAAIDDGLLFLTATVYSPDGTRSVVSSHAATPESHSLVHLTEAAEDVSDRVARDLLAGGAAGFAPIEVTS